MLSTAITLHMRCVTATRTFAIISAPGWQNDASPEKFRFTPAPSIWRASLRTQAPAPGNLRLDGDGTGSVVILDHLQCHIDCVFAFNSAIRQATRILAKIMTYPPHGRDSAIMVLDMLAASSHKP